MCLPLTSQRCVGCCQMPRILCITTRQLFVELDPCNREIRFCLCIRSSCKGAKRSQNKKLVHLNSLSLFLLQARQNSKLPPLGIFSPACGTTRNLHRCLQRACRVRERWVLSEGTVAPGLCSQGGRRCLPSNHLLHSGELLAGKVWGEHRPAMHASQGWRCSCQVGVEQARGYNNKTIRCKKTLCKMAQAIRPLSNMGKRRKYSKTYC